MGIDAITFWVDEFKVHLYAAERSARERLDEAQHRGSALVSKYSYRKDAARDGVGQEHLHIFARNAELFAINRDGTAHDDSHGVRIPNKVAHALRSEFPDWSIPSDNIIESFSRATTHTLLVQAAIQLAWDSSGEGTA